MRRRAHRFRQDRGSATLEIADFAGVLKTTYLLDTAEAGISRVAWDLRFDPPAATVKNLADNLKKQIGPALLRTDLKDDQKAALKKAAADLDKFGTNYRKVIEIQSAVLPIIRGGMPFGMGGGGRGRMGGGQVAEPGVYAVKLTVNGKTLTTKVTVRLDPMQSAAK